MGWLLDMNVRYLVRKHDIDMFRRSLSSLLRFVDINTVVMYMLRKEAEKIRKKMDFKKPFRVAAIYLDEMMKHYPDLKTKDLKNYQTIADCRALSGARCMLLDTNVMFFKKPVGIVKWWHIKSYRSMYMVDRSDGGSESFSDGLVLKSEVTMDFRFCIKKIRENIKVEGISREAQWLALRDKCHIESLPKEYWCSSEVPDEHVVAWNLIGNTWKKNKKVIEGMLSE